MEVQANYIKRIEIHGLWHRYDIAWDLRPDVNILSEMCIRDRVYADSEYASVCPRWR